MGFTNIGHMLMKNIRFEGCGERWLYIKRAQFSTANHPKYKRKLFIIIIVTSPRTPPS
uniref:Uncharacterized protein n=1 Tax=Rhizophora mucronata TaxID=61149 RepID=A0A2P2PA69_RHIMU